MAIDFLVRGDDALALSIRRFEEFLFGRRAVLRICGPTAISHVCSASDKKPKRSCAFTASVPGEERWSLDQHRSEAQCAGSNATRACSQHVAGTL